MTEIRLKDLRIEEEYSLGGLEVAVEKVGDNKKFKPITITKNGPYEGGIEDGKQVGFNPVVVDVPLPVEPLTVTENGVYEAEQGKGFNIVNVEVKFDKAAVIKQIVDARKSAAFLFQNATSLTDEDLAELIKDDTFENAESLVSCFGVSTFTKVPYTNTSKSKSWSSLFYHGNGFLVYFPSWDGRNVTDVGYAFWNLPSLKYMGAIDFRSVSSFNQWATNLPKLEEIWIKNIKASINVNFSAHVLVKCLIHLIYQLRDTGSAKTLIIGSINIEKIANVYVRIIKITDDVRERFEVMEGVVIENDDLIDEKMPFVVCEPTDEGAMPITEYALLKNWQIAG